MLTADANLCLFRHNGRIAGIPVTVSESGQGHVLLTTLGEYFGTLFSPMSTHFFSEGVRLNYVTGPYSQPLIPRQLACKPGQIIDITTTESGAFTGKVEVSSAHQVTTGIQTMQISAAISNSGTKMEETQTGSSLTVVESRIGSDLNTMPRDSSESGLNAISQHSSESGLNTVGRQRPVSVLNSGTRQPEAITTTKPRQPECVPEPATSYPETIIRTTTRNPESTPTAVQIPLKLELTTNARNPESRSTVTTNNPRIPPISFVRYPESILTPVSVPTVQKQTTVQSTRTVQSLDPPPVSSPAVVPPVFTPSARRSVRGPQLHAPESHEELADRFKQHLAEHSAETPIAESFRSQPVEIQDTEQVVEPVIRRYQLHDTKPVEPQVVVVNRQVHSHDSKPTPESDEKHSTEPTNIKPDQEDSSEHLTEVQETKLVLDLFRAHPAESAKRALIYNQADEMLSRRSTAVQDTATSRRLFVVLPPVNYKASRLQREEFKIHFVCEAGQDHTSLSTHIMDQEQYPGYSIRRPEEFFKRFGAYLLVMLETLRLGTDVGGHHFEPLTETGKDRLLLLTRIEQSVEYCQELCYKDHWSSDPLNWRLKYGVLKNYLSGMISDMELARVVMFLTQDGEDNIGGLFQTTGSDGNVKWVCKEHRPKIAVTTEDTRSKAVNTNLTSSTNSNDDLSEKESGVIREVLKSSIVARDLYLILRGATEFHELDLFLDWNVTYADLDKLYELVKENDLSTIKLKLKDQTGPEVKSEFKKSRYLPILGIMRHSSIKSITITGVNDFAIRSIDPHDNHGAFENLRTVRIPWSTIMNRAQFRTLFTQAKNVEKLDVDLGKSCSEQVMVMLNTVAQSRTSDHCKMEFTYWVTENEKPILRMIFPPLDKDKDWGPTFKDENEAEFFRQHANNILHLSFQPLADVVYMVAIQIVDESKINSLYGSFEHLDDSHRHRVSQIATRSELDRMASLGMNNVCSKQIFRSIQWSFLTTLFVEFVDIYPTVSIQNLRDCLVPEKGSPNKSLKRLALLWRYPVILPMADIFCQVLESLPLEELALGATTEKSIWLDIVEVINYSKLDRLHLETRDVFEGQWNTLLDRVPRNGGPLKLSLENAGTALESHSERMKAQKMTLEDETIVEFTDRWFQ